MSWEVKTPVTLGGNVGVGIPPALALVIFIIGGAIFFSLSFLSSITTGGIAAFLVSSALWLVVLSIQRRDRFSSGIIVEWFRAKERLFVTSVEHRGDFKWPL